MSKKHNVDKTTKPKKYRFPLFLDVSPNYVSNLKILQGIKLQNTFYYYSIVYNNF